MAIESKKYINIGSVDKTQPSQVNGGGVISVNGKTGIVELTAEDVGAMPLLKAIDGDLTISYEKVVGYETCRGQVLLTSVDFPNVKWGYMNDTFYNCQGLTEIKGFDKVTDGYFYYAFGKCSNLATIQDGVFSRFDGEGVNGPQYTGTFEGTFYLCSSLKTIPANMFGSVRYLRNGMFRQTFEAAGLEEIPTGFFGNIVEDENTPAINYAYAFYNTFKECKFESIPTGFLGNLKYIRNYEFSGTFMYCRQLKSIPDTFFDNLEGWAENDTTWYGNNGMTGMFQYCSDLEGSVVFRKLTRLGYYMLQSMFARTKISSISFPALTPDSFSHSDYTTFNYMLQGVTGCTVHFPANVQSVIGNWSSVTGGFSGTNTTVLFDLPNVE